MKVSKFLIVLASVFVASCSDKGVSEQTDTMGQVNLNLVADGSTIQLKTKAAEPTLTADMFKIRIENPTGETLKSWDSFSNLPSPIKINAGSYRFVASYGQNTFPIWDTPYYEGSEEFTIAANENKNISLNCTLAAVKVQINFDESFDTHYSYYGVEVRTVEDETKFLIFEPETEGRSAYFAAGKMNIRFRLISKADGKTYFFSANPIDVQLRESYTFNMSAKVNQGVGSIIINTDESTNDKEPIEVIIPRQ